MCQSDILQIIRGFIKNDLYSANNFLKKKEALIQSSFSAYTDPNKVALFEIDNLDILLINDRPTIHSDYKITAKKGTAIEIKFAYESLFNLNRPKATFTNYEPSNSAKVPFENDFRKLYEFKCDRICSIKGGLKGRYIEFTECESFFLLAIEIRMNLQDLVSNTNLPMGINTNSNKNLSTSEIFYDLPNPDYFKDLGFKQEWFYLTKEFLNPFNLVKTRYKFILYKDIAPI